MSLSTYEGLRTALMTRLDTDDISATDADDMFTEAELRIYRELRVMAMEAPFTVEIVDGVALIPPGYAELKFAYIDSMPSGLLQRRPASWIYLHYPYRTSGGRPLYIGQEGQNFIFGPYPNSGHSVMGTMYVKPPTVVNSTLNGTLLSNPDLLLYGALTEAEKFMGRDTRVVLWETRFQEIKAQVIAEDGRERHSGGPLAMNVA